MHGFYFSMNNSGLIIYLLKIGIFNNKKEAKFLSLLKSINIFLELILLEAFPKL